ncbi:hypothetical protein CVS40_1779 [Lucilia cuprina]|nr:hypothetical protein CVS40_1779 [Lucilia cuprina]
MFKNLAQVMWKNVSCHSTDEKYSKFEYCELRKNKTNNLSELSLYLKLLKVPVTDFKFQIAFSFKTMKTPINFNTTWDICEFMENKKRFNSLKKFYRMISDYTNINHTCPYDHDMFIANLGSMESEKNIPLISGVVNFKSSWITEGKVRVIVEGLATYNSRNWKRSSNVLPPGRLQFVCFWSFATNKLFLIENEDSRHFSVPFNHFLNWFRAMGGYGKPSYEAQITWKNILCHSTDENYAKFESCEIRENRADNMKELFLYIRMLKVPLTNLKFQLAFSLKTFRTPIIFNTTWDVCEFMANRKRYKSLGKIYHIISNFTNVNHTCPYNHDMFIKDLGPVESIVNIPLIKGLVNFRTALISDEKVRIIIEGVAIYQGRDGNRIQVDKNKRNKNY